MRDFVHIHNHSQYSKFDGFASVEGIVDKAKKLGMRAVGLTDHGTFAGAIDFLKACRAKKIKPILGMETYLARDHKCHDKQCQPDGRKGNRHLNIIAKNYKGFQNLCALSQAAALDGYYYDPRVDFELLAQHRDGLIITSACLSSVVNWNLSRDRYERAKKAVAMFKDIFGEDFYLEMMFHGIDAEAKILPDIQKLAQEMDVKTICTNDCFVAGTPILTQNGPVPIENITVGSCVFTHNRRWAKVYAINKRPLNNNEDVFRVLTRLGTYAYEATGNHKVQVCEMRKVGDKKIPHRLCWKRTDSLTASDYLVVPKISQSDIFCSQYKSITNLDLKCYLKNGFHLNQTFIENGIEYIFCSRTDRELKIPRYLPVNNLFLQVLGLYIAEGCVDIEANQIHFGFHISEIEFQNIIRSFFKPFGLSVTEIVRGNGISMRITSSVFSVLFSRLCGFNSLDKKLPTISGASFIGSWSKQQIFQMLYKYFEGDGHDNGQSYSIASVSRRLISEIHLCLLAAGYLCMPQERINTELPSFKNKYQHLSEEDQPQWNDTYLLSIGSFQRNRILREFIPHNDDVEILDPRDHHSHFLQDYNAWYVKIQSVSKIDYSGNVYNFSVEDDHSYVANMYIVRNCHYIEKADSEYHEYLMCMSSGRTVRDPKRIKFPYSEFYFKSPEEMNKIFGHVPTCLSNTIEIAEKCDYSDLIFVEDGGEMKLPKFEIPGEYESPHDYLERLGRDGMKSLGMDKSPAHVARFEQEISDLRLIWETNRYDFATYLLMIEDVMRFAKKEGISAGIRGSGYGSLLVKALGISEGIDPLEQNLMWERFLGFDSKMFISEADVGIKEKNKVKNVQQEDSIKKDATEIMFDRYI